METKIVFRNEPKLSEHEVDVKFNERRANLILRVKDFISTHSLFKDKEVSVTFAHKGISSLISIIETPEQKLVLKIPLSVSHSEGEAIFLKAWEDAGVRVPHVIEEGRIAEHSYVLMEYVDSKTLDESYTNEEQIEQGIYAEMGRTLATMHTPEAVGYGLVVDNKAQYSDFSEWLLGEDMQKRFAYVKENMLLGEEHGSLDAALEILTQHVKNENRSSYCHNDFGANNIFATHPITVFDPNPRFNNRYIDLGSSLVSFLKKGSIPDQFLEGYFGNNPSDERVLHAAIFLNICIKLPYAHKRKNLERIQNYQDYLAKNKHLLE